LIELIQEACVSGARLYRACDEADLPLRTYRRWLKAGIVQEDQRPLCQRSEPANKLSERERETILQACHLPEYADLPPTQIVPDLLDHGIYLGSESSFYRVLSEANQCHHRGRTQPPEKRYQLTSHTATGPNQLWSWDITYLPTAVKGQYYYLYLFEDIFSRKIVGQEVYESECGELAASLIHRCIVREQCFRKPLVLHSDNGAPMKALTMRAKMEELGIAPSHSRPRVSNDNPFSEALFKTLKYRANWPDNGFDSLESARDWVGTFVNWYNHEHKHSGINRVSPAERHAGLDTAILEQRRQILEAAKAANPQRWSGNIRNCKPVGSVTLNPENKLINNTQQAA